MIGEILFAVIGFIAGCFMAFTVASDKIDNKNKLITTYQPVQVSNDYYLCKKAKFNEEK